LTRVLYDTNVVLDVVLGRQPHYGASAAALNAAGDGRVQGFVAGHAVTTIAYLLQRQQGSGEARRTLVHLMSQLQVAPVTDRGVRLALAAAMPDFEDAVTAMAAAEAQMDVVVTRDFADFVGTPVPAVRPETFAAGL
jgi:predicted nucleic acid-binding protein